MAISPFAVLRVALKTSFNFIKSGTSTLGFVGISAMINGTASFCAIACKTCSILCTISCAPSTGKSTTSTFSIQAATRLAWSLVPP